MKAMTMTEMEEVKGGNACALFGFSAILMASAASIAGPAGLLMMAPAVTTFGQACFS